MRSILKVIDSISDWMGKTISWLCLALIGVVVYEVIARYVFNAPTVWAYLVVIIIGGFIYVLGWSYVHRYDGHIRVDIIYSQLSPRGRAIVNVICALVFFFPLVIVITIRAVPAMIEAWETGEVMIQTYWYPPSAPYRTMVVVGLCAFALQGLARFVRDLYFIIRNKTYD